MRISRICRVVVLAVAGSNPVAHPPRSPCKPGVRLAAPGSSAAEGAADQLGDHFSRDSLLDEGEDPPPGRSRRLREVMAAGMAGLSTARDLARAGVDVVVL